MKADHKTPVTVPDDEVPSDFRKIFGTVFDKIGGVRSLTQWARTHKTIFYSSMFKTLPQQIDAQVTHKVDDAAHEQLAASMVDALANAIDSAREERRRTGLFQMDGITYRRKDDGSLVPTDERVPLPYGAVITDNVGGHESPSIEGDYVRTTKAAPATPTPSPSQSGTPTPRNVVTPHIVRSAPSAPSIPGLFVGVALDGSDDDSKSTTQRFLEWNGHGGKAP